MRDDDKYTQTFRPVSLRDPPPVSIESGDGSIWAHPNSGHVRAAAGATLEFQSASSFSIEMRQIGGTKQDWPALQVKPVGAGFVCRTIVPDCTADPAPYYKYTIKIGDLTLDPIVIVDK
ncbi:MAG TPA: hypothetical protein VLV29_08125 [Steroidobacteraceae bacterium]|nr:hypothetical protein [Steroidobacteraceae bacterium]